MRDETRKEEKKWECEEAGREEKGGGAKGKISPCNDHGVEPQKPQSFAKEKVNIAKQNKTKENKQTKKPSHQNTRSTKCCCHPNVYKHSNHHGSYTFIY